MQWSVPRSPLPEAYHPHQPVCQPLLFQPAIKRRNTITPSTPAPHPRPKPSQNQASSAPQCGKSLPPPTPKTRTSDTSERANESWAWAANTLTNTTKARASAGATPSPSGSGNAMRVYGRQIKVSISPLAHKRSRNHTRRIVWMNRRKLRGMC